MAWLLLGCVVSVGRAVSTHDGHMPEGVMQERIGINDKLSQISVAVAGSASEIAAKIAEDHNGCGTSGGSGKSSCGTGAGAGDLAPEIWEKVKNL